MKFKKGEEIKLLEHKLKITKVSSHAFGNRVEMNCAPHCCTNPFHLKIEMAEKHLEEILKARQ